MSRTPLNKAELARKKRELATYQRFLPSLDMKRKQLLVERRRARRELDSARERVAALPVGGPAATASLPPVPPAARPF